MGGGGWWNQFPTFDAEFKFAKVQNSHVEGGWAGVVGGTSFQLLMLSPNLLKSKIPMSGGWVGGGGRWNQFPTFDAESNLLKKKVPGMVLDFEYQVYANHNKNMQTPGFFTEWMLLFTY